MRLSPWGSCHRAVGFTVALLFVAAAGRAETEQRHDATRPFDRTVTVTSSQALRIDHKHGDVRITTHSRNDLRVQATIRVSADSQQDADEFVDRIQIQMEEAPTAVTVRTQYPGQDWSRTRRNLSFAVDYVITMPERMALDVRNSFGAVSVTGARADVSIVNAHGTLSVADIGGRSRLENAFGPIEATRMNGDVTITDANGNVSATTIAGALNVTNRFGRVTVNGVKGTMVVANSNGQVDVADAAATTVTNSFGMVTVRDIAAATITNSNGAVRATNVRGAATVKTSFAPAEIATVAGNVDVTNSNGDVTLRDVGGSAEIRSSFGRVEAQDVKGGVRVNTGNSGVRVMNADGPVFVKASFGLVTLERVRGSITVDNSNGGVQASGVRGTADVTTSFGPVMLRDIDGKIDVRNRNGAIDVSPVARPGACHDVTLVTSFSPIQVQLPAAGYTVTAQTSFGRIRTEMPITSTGTIGENTLSGTIGGGGCALQLTNANGDIRIAGAPAR